MSEASFTHSVHNGRHCKPSPCNGGASGSNYLPDYHITDYRQPITVRLSNSSAHSPAALLLTFQPQGQLSKTRLTDYSSDSLSLDIQLEE